MGKPLRTDQAVEARRRPSLLPPYDIDLLRGVRHLLYGEGYTIRGVQRLLREQGQSFVQGVWRAGAETLAPELDGNGSNDIQDQADVSSDDGRSLVGSARGRAAERRPNERREPKLVPPNSSEPAPQRIATVQRRKLQTALDDLIACRRVLDAALSETPVAQD